MKKNTQAGWIPSELTPKECSDTGMAMVLICLLAAWFTGVRTWHLAAIVLLVVNMTWPRAYTLAAKVWLGFSNILGAIMSKVILSLVFFLVLTPLALLRRMFGHDPMLTRQWKKSSDSVFETRDHAYTSKEIEQPF